jgi:hypothetical protein
MKRSIFFFVLVFIGLTSCRKSHSCTCTTTDSTGEVINVEDEKTFEGTKKDAKQVCNRSGKNGEYYTECTLKN